MSLSSRNRSNSKASRHILPSVAPVCEGMHYHKTGVPWQTKRMWVMMGSFLFLVTRDQRVGDIRGQMSEI